MELGALDDDRRGRDVRGRRLDLRAQRARARWLEEVAGSEVTVVCFEAPGRVGRLLTDLAGACGAGRLAALVAAHEREMCAGLCQWKTGVRPVDAAIETCAAAIRARSEK